MSKIKYDVTIVTQDDSELSISCTGDQLRELLDMLKNGDPIVDEKQYGVWIPPSNISFVSFKQENARQSTAKIVDLNK